MTFYEKVGRQSRVDQRQYYDRRGLMATQRIAKAVAKKSWKWTLLNLAWTVGPVTFIALHLGSMIGLGKVAANETFIYFAVYTAVAGVLAMIGSVVHDAFYKPKIEQEQQRLLSVIDQLYNLTLATRDALLEELEPNERRIMSAYYLLSGAGMSDSALGNAVMDLTEDAELARHARRVSIFSEQGMDSRVQDEWHMIEPRLESVRETLEPIAPHAYALLKDRLKGGAARIQNGLERTNGFIERVLIAADAEDESFMTLNDAHEMLTLAFELLNGRQIAMLDVRFQGDGTFERAQQDYDEARHQFRIALRQRNSRIRLLAERLYQETDYDGVAEATDSISRLIRQMTDGLRGLSPNEQLRYRRYYMDDVYRRHKLAQQRYSQLQRAERAYRKAWEKDGHKLRLTLESRSIKQNRFMIIEREIALRDKQKIELSRDIDVLLEDIDIRSGSRLRVYDTSEDDLIMRMDANRYKRFAMAVAGALDDLIDMSQPEEQLAIESSNSGNFASLNRRLSPQTKAGWASTIVDAMHENRRKASHRLARSIVRFYRVRLSDDMMQYFEDQFGAQRDYLESLNEEALEETIQSDHLPAAPYPIPNWKEIFYDPHQLAAYAN